MATTLISPEEVAKMVPAVVDQARNLTVRDGDDYEMACTFLTLVANRKRQVEETFDPIVRKAHETHKEAVAQKKKFMDPLLLAEGEVKLKVARWRNEQERLRQAKEARLQAEAKRQADEQALQEAAHLAAAGESDLADMRLTEAAAAPAPVVVLESSVPKAEGIAARKDWKWRYQVGETATLRELVKAAAADERFLPFLMVKETEITATAKRQKDLARIPGVEVYPEDSVSVRTR